VDHPCLGHAEARYVAQNEPARQGAAHLVRKREAERRELALARQLQLDYLPAAGVGQAHRSRSEQRIRLLCRLTAVAARR
jgi:hypothetical protein